MAINPDVLIKILEMLATGAEVGDKFLKLLHQDVNMPNIPTKTMGGKVWWHTIAEFKQSARLQEGLEAGSQRGFSRVRFCDISQSSQIIHAGVQRQCDLPTLFKCIIAGAVFDF